MLVNLMKSKLHRVHVTEANLNYVGSITIDEELMDATGIIANERVQICNVNNGNRLETYVIPGERGSGIICLNGAAAHLVDVGDIVIIIAYTWMEKDEASSFLPSVVFVDADNKIIGKDNGEVHGMIL